MKLLQNPTDNDITIIYKAPKSYTIKAGGELEVDDDVARFWLKLHPFLFISKIEKKIEVEPEIKDVEMKEGDEEIIEVVVEAKRAGRPSRSNSKSK